MPDKHRGAVDFQYVHGAFSPLSSSEPFQLFRLFECESHQNKKVSFVVDPHMKFLLLCVSGHGEITCDDSKYVLCEKAGLTGANGEYCLSAVGDAPCVCICLLFGVVSSWQQYDKTELLPLMNTFHALDRLEFCEQTVEFSRAFSALLLELSLPEPTMLLVKGHFYQTLVMAYRELLDGNRTDVSASVDIHAVGQTVYAIIRYIDEHLYAINNLMDMAQELGYSYNYLSHLFRRKTGMTIQAYVTQKKIEQSTRLLVDEQLSVTKIASMLNYDCIQSFSKAFRRAMRVSPTEFRARCKQNKQIDKK